MKSHKSFFSEDKIDKFIDKNPLLFKANDNVFQTLNTILENADLQKNNDLNELFVD